MKGFLLFKNTCSIILSGGYIDLHHAVFIFSSIHTFRVNIFKLRFMSMITDQPSLFRRSNCQGKLAMPSQECQ
uniref:Uncharacterized protein n=1 Tax=Arundo donax TaxID=35708 RepID=A0A0A9DY39_ARUDO